MAKNHSHPAGWQRFLAGTLGIIKKQIKLLKINYGIYYGI